MFSGVASSIPSPALSPGSLIFECQTHRRSDDTPPPYPLVYPGTLGHVSDERRWRLIVQSYTSRQLSFASDKLPAVAGIVSLMPQATRSRYLAGLWSHSLLEDLLWNVMPSSARSTTVMTYRFEEQQSPSWSWASLKQGVLWNEMHNFEPLVEVLDAQCGVIGLNAFGMVSGGHVTLRGRLTPCRVTHSYQKGQHHAYIVRPDGTRSAQQWFLGDGMLVASTSGNHPALQPVARRATPQMENTLPGDFDAAAAVLSVARVKNWRIEHVGLVVSWSKTRPGYIERIGLIMGLSTEWFEQGELTVITLL